MASSALTVVSAEGPILERVLDATFTIWHEGLSRAAYGQWWTAQLRTPWGAANLRRSALIRGNEVLASAKEYHLAAVLDGQPMAVLGIGAVFTQPDHRGHGYARQLVERVVERASQRGAGIALLFSEIGADYYRALGFEPIVTGEAVVSVSESSRRGAPAVLVRAGERRAPASCCFSSPKRARQRPRTSSSASAAEIGSSRKRAIAIPPARASARSSRRSSRSIRPSAVRPFVDVCLRSFCRRRFQSSRPVRRLT
jgi:GNAT superfamily N-acetyltransferase